MNASGANNGIDDSVRDIKVQPTLKSTPELKPETREICSIPAVPLQDQNFAESFGVMDKKLNIENEDIIN